MAALLVWLAGAQSPNASQNRMPASNSSAVQELPTLYIVGDSIVHNGPGNGANGQWGWGDLIGVYFDPAKINVLNWALPDMGGQTLVTEEQWQPVQNALRPGDFVMIEFSEDDSAPANMSAHKRDAVHTDVWYLHKYITDVRARRATPILCMRTPRHGWQDGRIVTNDNEYLGSVRQLVQQQQAPLINLSEILAQRYKEMGTDKTKQPLGRGQGPSTLAVAELNAEAVVAGLKALQNDPLAPYFSMRAEQVVPAAIAQ